MKKDVGCDKMKQIKKKSKKNIYSIAVIILLISMTITFSFCYLLTPKIKVENTNLTFSYNEKVILPKYQAYALNKRIDSKVKIINPLKKQKVGKYFVTYQVKNAFFSTKKLVLITIVDKEKPQINLKGNQIIYLCPNEKYIEPGFTATDKYDGNLTKKVLIKEEGNTITYQVEDSSHNKTVTKRKIYFQDKEKPQIFLKGAKEIYLSQNTPYKEEGYEIKDNCDKDVTVEVSGKVDSTKIGTYTIRYTATDSSNNTTTVERKVNITKKTQTTPGIIYLTFDDGPSNSITPKILEILKKKNIKATFFVINHEDNLNYLIKQEDQDGHTVALHSYTHSYQTIYQSSEAYFNDLNQIRDKVYKITGKYSNIIRFPGGSSNTISKKYHLGIMTQLSNEVTTKGFHYFDWNVDCQDGAGVRDSNKIYQNVINNLSKTKENVVLMHDFENNYGTLNALESIIDYGINNGYQFQKITMDTEMITHRPNN